MKKIIPFLIGLLVLSQVGFAAIATYPQQGIMGFRGLDDKSSPTAIEDGRASDLQNVNFSLTYGISKRNGYSVVNDVMDVPDEDFQPVEGLYYTKLSDGTKYRLAIVGQWMWYDDGDDWLPIWGKAFTADQDNQFVFTTALDTIVGTNDEDTPLKVTATDAMADLNFTGLTDALTKAKCVAWFKNYLIWGNTYEATTERPTRIRWSNVGTVETYSDDDYIDIAELGGQEIEAFGILYDNLYIFFTDSIYKLSLVGGDDIFIASKVVDDIGCIAKNSVQNITLRNAQRGLIFLDKDKKVYFFNGITAQYISTLIETTMDALVADRLQYAVSADTGTDYYLCVTTGSGNTTNNLLLDFQYEIGEWSKHTQIDSNAMVKVVDEDENVEIYSGNYEGFVYKLDDADLDSDIGGASGTVDSVFTHHELSTVSSIQVLYDESQSLTASALIGATIRITDGTASGEERVVIDNTTTGIIVDSDFTVTPDTTSAFTIGDIDAYYTTKWYDLGDAARNKHFTELFLWADEKGDMTMTASYAVDFPSTLDTKNVSLLGTGGVWGTSVWGTGVWGGQDVIFKRVKMPAEGRYVRIKFIESDIDETFQLYGYKYIYEPLDIY